MQSPIESSIDQSSIRESAIANRQPAIRRPLSHGEARRGRRWSRAPVAPAAAAVLRCDRDCRRRAAQAPCSRHADGRIQRGASALRSADDSQGARWRPDRIDDSRGFRSAAPRYAADSRDAHAHSRRPVRRRGAPHTHWPGARTGVARREWIRPTRTPRGESNRPEPSARPVSPPVQEPLSAPSAIGRSRRRG